MRANRLLLSLAIPALLAGCGGGGAPAPTATPTPTPVQTGGGGQTAFTYDVEPCFTQVVPGTGETSNRLLDCGVVTEDRHFRVFVFQRTASE